MRIVRGERLGNLEDAHSAAVLHRVAEEPAGGLRAKMVERREEGPETGQVSGNVGRVDWGSFESQQA